MSERGGAIRVRLLEDRDLSQMALVHRSCFPDDLYSGLGGWFLQRFYRCLLTFPQTKCAIVEQTQTGKVGGVAVGSLNPALYKQIIFANAGCVTLSVLIGLFRSKAVRQAVKRALRSARRLFHTEGLKGMNEAGIPTAKGPVARLVYIGLLPEFRGGGHAQLLLRFCTDELFSIGAQRVAGIVQARNLPSLIMYKKVTGWNLRKTDSKQFHVWADRE